MPQNLYPRRDIAAQPYTKLSKIDVEKYKSKQIFGKKSTLFTRNNAKFQMFKERHYI